MNRWQPYMRGLFGGGAPQRLDSVRLVGGDFAPQTPPQPQMAPQRPQIGTGRMVAGTIGDALMQLAGLRPTFGPALQEQRAMDWQREQATLAEQRRQRERAEDRANSWTDWQARQQWERDNPPARAPDAFDTAIRNAGIDPASPEGQALYRQRADSMANPMQYLPNGDGTYTVVPRAGTPQGRASGAPQSGEVVGGYRFRGGNPNDRANWEPVGGRPAGNAPFDAGRLDAITARSESGNRDYDRSGQPVRSPRGALYAMQVMPSTARDPGFGLRPANPNDPADMNRLGREYRAMLERRYGGDPALMWAAYNAGPGAVDNARRRYGRDWFRHMPAETRNYVTRNMRDLRGR